MKRIKSGFVFTVSFASSLSIAIFTPLGSFPELRVSPVTIKAHLGCAQPVMSIAVKSSDIRMSLFELIRVISDFLY